MNSQATSLLRLLPSVDALLHSIDASGGALYDEHRNGHLTAQARDVIETMRGELRDGKPLSSIISDVEITAYNFTDAPPDNFRQLLLQEAVSRLTQSLHIQRATANNLRRVINATGVVLHTNLGRAPLSVSARERVAGEVAGYCTLEYDLATGERGRRGGRVEDLLCELTGAEAAIVVNNCAAATLLVLTVLASDGETIISRGELVEIGGDFRIPDVMRLSNTSMIEVGTTNRTRVEDYARAVTAETRLIARVHPSNYRIVGFTHAPSLEELAALCRASNLTLYEDAGSGALTDFSSYTLNDEPVISRSIRAGVDIVSFSADKLLGASQAGIIVGRENLIERIRRAPLARALRIDKLSLAALEATLEAHARASAFTEVPALRMIALTQDEIRTRATAFVKHLRDEISAENLSTFDIELRDDSSAIGGGSAPTTHPPTVVIAIAHHQFSAGQLACTLRQHQPLAVIARIAENRVLIDLRTVAEDEEDELRLALKHALGIETPDASQN